MQKKLIQENLQYKNSTLDLGNCGLNGTEDELILLLAEHDYPPVERNEVYQEIFEQAENFKKNQN